MSKSEDLALLHPLMLQSSILKQQLKPDAFFKRRVCICRSIQHVFFHPAISVLIAYILGLKTRRSEVVLLPGVHLYWISVNHVMSIYCLYAQSWPTKTLRRIMISLYKV